MKDIFSRIDKNYIRITELKPIGESIEIQTDTVWFQKIKNRQNYAIEHSLRAVKKYNIEHIHIQTDSIEYLVDKRLKNIKGISIQYKVDDLTPLYYHQDITHLSLPEGMEEEVDFSNFPNLKYLGGQLPKKYKNFDKLTCLRYTYLFNYKKSNFQEFNQCKNLKKLEIYSCACENFTGLEDLKELLEIKLELCPKLSTLSGINSVHTKLEKIYLINCKKLEDISSLSEIKNLKTIQLFKIPNLDSLEFLSSLKNLENIYIHPANVGVKYDNYYPLVNKLKSLNKIDELKNWKELNNYLENKIEINKEKEVKLSEFQLIKKNLTIKGWTEKLEFGLDQYTENNCLKAENIIISLIDKLESNESLDLKYKTELIKECVISLNDFNNEIGGDFIETGEREELCELFDNIADAAGIDIHEFEDGIASEWREW